MKVFYLFLTLVSFICLSILSFIVMLTIAKAFGLNLETMSEYFWVLDLVSLVVFIIAAGALIGGD